MTLIGSLRRSLRLPRRQVRQAVDVAVVPIAARHDGSSSGEMIEIPANDPLFGYLQAASGVVEADRLELDSPALEGLRASGVTLIVPLVTHGELIGALYLGPRLSDQEYSSDDRRLLGTLAQQAAPAIRVAQLVQEQAAELRARERMDEELRVATLIQQQFLPRRLPALRDWQVAAYYGPARAVGGDFYDFMELSDGRIGIVVGDVTDKGVPAALVMARTHTILRSEAPRLISPAAVLARANELLVAEMPERMFVTCLYLVLDPPTGRVVFANAGHNLPYVRTADGVLELRATGLPLGLLAGIEYEENEAVIGSGDHVLLYSDGLIEAHDPSGAMYGFPRLREAVDVDLPGQELIDALLDGLHGFVGRGWEQEDDITLVTLQRTGGRAEATIDPVALDGPVRAEALLDIEIPGAIGNERRAMDLVVQAVRPLDMPTDQLERLKTAVSETAMNAIEYGSRGDPGVPVRILVERDERALRVHVTDRALGGRIVDPEEPDLDAKLAGLQKPRGWGLFLIRHMVDEVHVESGTDGQTVTLVVGLPDGAVAGVRDATAQPAAATAVRPASHAAEPDGGSDGPAA